MDRKAHPGDDREDGWAFMAPYLTCLAFAMLLLKSRVHRMAHVF
ncbi:MAG: hypothetical protein VB089_16050 [Anaerolineaceae bacterium]|nr:hypothetical protein [Anaerolineaceae bacterium]